LRASLYDFKTHCPYTLACSAQVTVEAVTNLLSGELFVEMADGDMTDLPKCYVSCGNNLRQSAGIQYSPTIADLRSYQQTSSKDPYKP